MLARSISAGLLVVALASSCRRTDPADGGPTALGSATAVWLETFPAFPAAREAGTQHISGIGSSGPMHILCHVYATSAAPEDVVAFYAARIPDAKRDGPRSLSARAANERALSVHPVDSSDYPRCGATLAATDRTVVVVTQAIR